MLWKTEGYLSSWIMLNEEKRAARKRPRTNRIRNL
nr:MAG TPA: hypothetical protein [Caudoviricetes sp.]